MATFKSNLYDTSDAGTPFMPTSLDYDFTVSVSGTVTFANPTTLAAADIVAVCPIPLNHQVIGFWIQWPNMDPAGTGALTLSIGDNVNGSAQYFATTASLANLTAVFSHIFSGSTGTAGATAATTIVPVKVGAIPTSYTARNASRLAKAAADDLLITLVAGGSATSAVRTLYFTVWFKAYLGNFTN